MSDQLRVLLVENSTSEVDLIVRFLEEAGHQVAAERVEDAASMRTALAGKRWDVIIADYQLPHFDAPAALDTLQQACLDIPFIVVSGTAGEEVAVSMMRAGARDYLMKDNPARLASVVEREIRDARVRLERLRAQEALGASQEVLEAILNSIPVRVFWKDRNLEYLGCNSAFARDAGFDKPQDIVGKDDRALGWREQAERYRADDRAVIDAGVARMLFEEPQTTPSGERIHLLTSKVPLRNARGEIAGVLGTYYDITDRKRAEDALRESEETHRALIAGLPDIVMRFDRAGRHLFVSDRVHDMVDVEAGRFLGRTHRELGFPEPHCRFWEEALRRVFDGGESFETEFTIEAKQGPATYNCRLIPEHDRQGMVRSVLTLSRDISPQRRAEENYQMLFREMLDGFALHRILCDPEGRPNDYRFLAVNGAFERMTGLRSEDIVGKTVLEVLPETERSWIEIYGKVALTGEPAFFENYHFGLRKHFRVTAFQPAPGQFACLFADVTDRKQAENALRESERRHRTILQTAMDGFWCVSLQGRFLEVSQAYCRMSGFQEEELLAMAIPDIEAVETHSEVAAHIDKILACGEGRFETRHRRKDGSSFPVEVSVQYKPEFPGQLVCFVRDLTQRKRAEEEGRISEQRYRSLFRHMQSGFTYCEMQYDDQNRPVDFVTLEVNDAFGRITGLRDVVGKRITDVIPGVRESVPELFEVQGRVALTGKPENFELDFKSIGRWLSLSVYSPEPRHCVAAFDDITERKRHEADREAMVALLRLLNSPNDTRGLIQTVTEMLREWLGCEAVGIRLQIGDQFPYYEHRGFPAEFIESETDLSMRDADNNRVRDGQGNLVLECLCGGMLRGLFDVGQPCISAGGSFCTNSLSELMAARTWGGLRTRCTELGYESVALVPLRSSGRILGLLQFSDRRRSRFTPALLAQMERAAASLAIALEQRQTQEALRTSEERYRLISENTADMIWLLDLDSGRFTYVSPSVRRVLGYSPDELIETGIRLTLTEESYEFVTRRIAELVAASESGQGAQTEVHRLDQVHKNGTIIQTEVSATVLTNHQGRAGTILGVTRDITERVQTEARLMQAQKLESVGRLAGGVAHDFNNLLTVINGYSNLLLGELLPGDPVRDGIAEIGTAGQRAAALTPQLLTLSRKQVVQVKVVNLNEIIVEVARMLGRVIGEDIELISVLSPELGYVLADPGQIHQLLMNLAVNARDAMPGGGTLRIETANVYFGKDDLEQQPDLKPRAYIQLKVIDTGIGMTREVLSHLFEPFFTTKRTGEGTGLGLATVYGIVKQYGGSIDAVSEPGHGTTFSIFLPRIETEPTEQRESEPNLSQLRGTETVLVVEDQDQLRRMVARVLRSHGYRVYESANPGEALMQAERHAGPIHLLLTDVVMPGMSGHELAVRLKPLRPDMEVLFMSGYCDQVTAAGQLPDGAYLAKPFAPDVLAAKVREVLGASRPAVTILVADDESSVRSLLSQILTGAGYRVLKAGNGKEAVQQIKTAKVDLLITDLAMPEQEGIETIETVHRLRPEVKVIAMSGQFGGALLEAAEHLGADASIAKPVAPDTLLNLVARVLGK